MKTQKGIASAISSQSPEMQERLRGMASRHGRRWSRPTTRATSPRTRPVYTGGADAAVVEGETEGLDGRRGS
jgi:hypothetical protein